MIHTKIWDSGQVLKLRPIERLLFIGMITLGDDEGRLRGDAIYLRKMIFPNDKYSRRQVEEMCRSIENQGLILMYEVEKSKYIQHPSWARYQKLRTERCKQSDFPPPPADIRQTSVRQSSAQDKVSEDKLSKGKVSEDNALSDVQNRSPATRMISGMNQRTADFIQSVRKTDT